jgi:HEAT repeat protein
MAQQKAKKKAEKPASKTEAENALPKPKYNPTPNPNRVFDKGAVDKSFEALRTYDWGMDYDVVQPIDDAVAATYGDLAARKDLETRLAAVLKTSASRPAKDYSCRVLSDIGTADSVPVLAELLTDKELSHMARFALERIAGPAPVAAMRDALPKVSGVLKAGLIESLGARRDSASVAVLTGLVENGDPTIAFAAINALGKIGTPEAGVALGGMVTKAPAVLKPIAADASLACAECLAADGKKAGALLLYKGLSGTDQPKHVRLAAVRGLLTAAGKKE